MDTDFDLYDDVLTDKDQEKLPTRQGIDRWRSEVDNARDKVQHLMGVNYELKKKIDTLQTNISSLLKTSRSEINRKNNTIAELRRELESVVLRRTLKTGSSSEIRDLTERLKKVLREDKPVELPIPEGPKKVKKGVIELSHYSLDDVHTVKVGNTSFTCVIHGDTKVKPKILTVQRTNPQATKTESIKVGEPSRNKRSERLDEIRKDGRQELDSRKDDRKRKDTRKDHRREERSCSTRDDRRRDERAYPRREDRHDLRREDPRKESRRSSSRDFRSESRKENSRDNNADNSSRIDLKSSKSDPKRARSSSERTDLFKDKKSEKKSSTNEQEGNSISADIVDMETTDLEKLLEAKQKMLENLAKVEKNLLLASATEECDDDTIVKVVQAKTRESSIKSGQSSKSEGKRRDSNERITAKNDKKAEENPASISEKPQTSVENLFSKSSSEECVDDTIAKVAQQQQSPETAKDGEASSRAGFPSTFLGNWANFSQCRTPPQHNKARLRTDSEASSVDFNSIAGIASILKGQLVPGSYVSPRTGMIRTPTPTRKTEAAKPESASKAARLQRTRNRSKESAKEIHNDENNDQNIAESLGLDISSSSADELSPQKKVVKKRKRPTLSFSTEGQTEGTCAKRKIIA